MLPSIVTDAAIENELPGAMAWAERHGIVMDTRLLSEKIIRLVLLQKSPDEKFFLQCKFDDYKALPPIWDWRDESWLKSNEPNLGPNPQNNSIPSMFIKHNNKSIICAPFNRLAYSQDGPHSGWGNPAQWMTVALEHIHAVTLGDMLQSIMRDFRFTKGRMV